MFKEITEKLVQEFTLNYGILGLVLIALSYLVYQLTMRILSDKDKQISELSNENKEYRERFTKLLDKQFNFEAKEKTDI